MKVPKCEHELAQHLPAALNHNQELTQLEVVTVPKMPPDIMGGQTTRPGRANVALYMGSTNDYMQFTRKHTTWVLDQKHCDLPSQLQRFHPCSGAVLQ